MSPLTPSGSFFLNDLFSIIEFDLFYSDTFNVFYLFMFYFYLDFYLLSSFALLYCGDFIELLY